MPIRNPTVLLLRIPALPGLRTHAINGSEYARGKLWCFVTFGYGWQW